MKSTTRIGPDKLTESEQEENRESQNHRPIPVFQLNLTVIESLAALGNTALNLTSLGRYPRGGLGGASAAASPTTWQHTVGGAAGRAEEYSRASNP
jgi:hypothetical protein